MRSNHIDFNAYPYASIKVSDINFANIRDNPILDSFGNVYFFLGRAPEAEGELRVGTIRRNIGKSKLFRVEQGHIYYSDFETDYHKDKVVKILCDYYVQLPDRGASKFYGVNNLQGERKIDQDLTRNIFGLTQEEFDQFLRVMSLILNIYSEYSHKPCTTSSNTRDNICDLTNRWIPVGFPYVSFGDNNTFGSHVSLAGAYAFISLLCLSGYRNKMYHALIEHDIDESLLHLIEDANFCFCPPEIYSKCE